MFFDALIAFSDFVRDHQSVFLWLFVVIILSETLWLAIRQPDISGRALPESRKEQIKLRATMFNNLAVAMFTIGVLSPLVAALYQVINAPTYDRIVSLFLGWLAAGIAFHFFGAITLRGLR